MKLHLAIGQYEFVEIDVADDTPLKELQDLYRKLHDFPTRVPAKKWTRPKEELLTGTDKMSAL